MRSQVHLRVPHVSTDVYSLALGSWQNGEEEDEEDDEEEDDEEYNPEVTGPAVSQVASDPPPAISRKRSRNENEDEEDVSGDYGEFEENSETVNKKARAAAEGEEE